MPYDNAMAESFFATLKLELIDDKSFKDREAARSAVFEYVELFYNRVRMHSALGYRSPVEAERGLPNGQVCILTTRLWNAGQSNLTPFFKPDPVFHPIAARLRYRNLLASRLQSVAVPSVRLRSSALASVARGAHQRTAV